MTKLKKLNALMARAEAAELLYENGKATIEEVMIMQQAAQNAALYIIAERLTRGLPR